MGGEGQKNLESQGNYKVNGQMKSQTAKYSNFIPKVSAIVRELLDAPTRTIQLWSSDS